MTVLKWTKNELRIQQAKLSQFRHYLPTLQLKKTLLQFEVNHAHLETSLLKEEFSSVRAKVEPFSTLLLEKVDFSLTFYADAQHVKKNYENIAGVEIPVLERVFFRELDYFLFDAPVWAESAVEILRALVVIREKINVAEEKMHALERELREVSIRVNLFEKVLIPRTLENIKKIRIFLGDQQLASVAQAKVAKMKILARKEGR